MAHVMLRCFLLHATLSSRPRKTLRAEYSNTRFDNYVSIYVMFAVACLECVGLRLGSNIVCSRGVKKVEPTCCLQTRMQMLTQRRSRDDTIDLLFIGATMIMAVKVFQQLILAGFILRLPLQVV